MKLIELKCPYCEGSVKLDVDEELKSYYCLHCGKKIVDEETVNALYKEIYADEPSAVDTKEDIQALELERCCFNMPIMFAAFGLSALVLLTFVITYL